MPIERWNVVFLGHVQGVGFRFRTKTIADNYSVTGWVANLDNGQVKMLVEGQPAEIAGFINDIKEKMAGFIRQVEIEKTPARGGFNSFEIRHSCP